jgi:hypothetical protein
MNKKQRPPRIQDFLKAGIQSSTLRQPPEPQLREFNFSYHGATTVDASLKHVLSTGQSVMVYDLETLHLLQERLTAVKLNQVYIDFEDKFYTVDDVKHLIAQNKALMLTLETSEYNALSQRDMKDRARRERDIVTTKLEHYRKALDIGIEYNLSCASVKQGIENFTKSSEK